MGILESFYHFKLYTTYPTFYFIYQQVFLDHRPREEVALLVSTRTNGATPMLMACRNGHLEVVEYLYERCDADIEQAGSGIFLPKINRAKVSDRPPSISITCPSKFSFHLNVVFALCYNDTITFFSNYL